ncbi:MAG: ArnT family glycosyltransferase [Anaerolineae bacterium]|jgi:4-amino-4-deoxy-L-arabinose transferase-like glycosyltransferase|nr:phospholipid carrier-dependent glycosyltransferase [Chloroflexota bacterium]
MPRLRALFRGKDVWGALALGLALVMGAVVRTVRLGDFPPALHFDEAVYGLMARQIGPGYWPVFFSGYTGREPLYMYLMAGVFRLLGSTDVTLRLTSALIGIATLVALYWLGRELYGKRLGLLATGVMAGNYWAIAMSRNGYPNVLIPPLECLALVCLWRGYRDRRPLWMALGGIFVGTVLYTYLAARLFPVTLVLYALYVLIVDRPRDGARLGGAALAVGLAALVFAPLGLHFYHHPHDFMERASQVLVFESGGGWADWLRMMARNYWANLGALFVRGDIRPLYNLPGKPILTPLLAPFLLIGLGVSLRRGREVAYGLLPILLVGMCLPAVLTDDIMPQSQRMTGTMPAIYLLVGLGLEQCLSWLAGQFPRGRRWAVLAVVALLLLEGGRSAWTYFGVWGRDPANYYHFHKPYELAARDASAQLDRGRQVVLISEHYRHPTAVFEEPRLHDALWLVQNRTIVLPAASRGEAVVYWPHHPLVDQPYIEHRLPELTELVGRVQDGTGATALGIYRFRPEVLAAEIDRPARAALAEIEVLDWTLPAAVPRDKPLEVELVWRVRDTTQEGRVFAVHLVDAQGRLWSQQADLGFMPEQWRPGDTVYQLFSIPLPEGIPAGSYEARFVVADSAAVPMAVSVDGKSAGFALPLGSVELSSAGATLRPPQPGGAFGAELQLTRWPQWADLALAAPTLDLELEWQAVRQPARDYMLQLSLVDASGAVAWRGIQPLGAGHATSHWLAGEIVRPRYTFELADLAPGSYQALLSVGEEEQVLSLGTLVVSANLRSFVVPEMEHTVGALLGGTVELLGYDLSPEPSAGGDLSVTLYWRALQAPLSEAKVFVHMVDASGAIHSQVDAVPAQWQRPTSGWLEGEVITDQHVLELPADLAAGDYALLVGLYDANTLDKWQAVPGEAELQADGRLRLATVTLP